MTITLTQKTPFTEFSSWYGREVTRVPVHWAGPDGEEHFAYPEEVCALEREVA